MPENDSHEGASTPQSEGASPIADQAKRNLKSRLEVLANSAVVVALVSVLGTGVIGSIIAGSIQDRNKQRELATIAYREYQSGELAAVKEAYKLLGDYYSASQNLIYMARPEFQPGQYQDAGQKQQIEEQASRLRQEYNLADSHWRQQKESTGFLITYFHHGRKGISESWRRLEDAAEKFNGCAYQLYLQQGKVWGTQPCKAEQKAVEQQFDKFAEDVDAARQDVWDRWGVVPKQ